MNSWRSILQRKDSLTPVQRGLWPRHLPHRLRPDPRAWQRSRLEAAQRADAMLEKGSVDGQRVWKRVLAAVKEIQREVPREGEAVN